MKTVGLITEYNPFHNGHLYHLQRAKELCSADHAVAVMSGNFVQRGLPAIVDKYSRTRAALLCGVDAVAELPVVYALSSAEGFARGAVKVLDDLGVVTDIIYGSEAGEEGLALIRQIAYLFVEEPAEFKNALKGFLSEGIRFPAARAFAAEKIIKGSFELLSSPNNILAVEYEKAILKTNSPIKTHTVKRNDGGYLKSASDIRAALEAGDRDGLDLLLPKKSLDCINYCVKASDFSERIGYMLSVAEEEELENIAGFDRDLALRIKDLKIRPLDFDGLVKSLSAKSIPESRIRRCLFSALLRIEKEAEAPDFIRILGFNKSSGILKMMKNKAKRQFACNLSDIPSESYLLDERAALVYNETVKRRYGPEIPDEYHVGVICV